jgi:hypothetical protein
VFDDNLTHRRRQLVARVVAELDSPLGDVMAPTPPKGLPWGQWRADRDDLQEALRGFVGALRRQRARATRRRSPVTTWSGSRRGA